MNHILADAGPLVALLDAKDADHELCVESARRLTGLLLTTWPVLTEALYLLAPDWTAQDRLLSKLETGDIALATLDSQDVPQLRALIRKYRDLPMDLADATLVHVGNREKIETVFTLDSDFAVYRLAGGRSFTMHP